VGEPLARDRVGEGAHHRLLADQLVEALRAVFAGEDAVGLRGFGHLRVSLGQGNTAFQRKLESPFGKAQDRPLRLCPEQA
jgi:hypothetical protein